MNILYNIILTIGEVFLKLIGNLSFLLSSNSKLRKSAEGQRHLLERIEKEFVVPGEGTITVWIHAASLGEYGVARPIIKRLKEEHKCCIVLTFFSPTGYEVLHRYHPEVDYVYYLPLDTRKNACRFLEIIRPQKAVFIISEYWMNYLHELKTKGIRTYLVSAIISRHSPFFRWYGSLFRQSLDAYTHFMVLNETSQSNLRKLGYDNLTITGDPLFDNAIAVASTPWHNPVVDEFAKQGDLFIAGSISDRKDTSLICSLANRHRDIHFIIVPHEICEENLNALKFHLEGNALCYSECDESTDFSNTQVLIIDFLGALAYLYRYGKWAYVGGGFTPYLHSIIEATVYGLPVAFGPKIHRKVTPNELIKRGIGCIVRSPQELERWFATLKGNETALEDIRRTAKEYTRQNSGATSHIIRLLNQA